MFKKLDTKHITGLDDLSRKLSKLKVATAQKALRSATMTSTLPAIKKMKMSVPVGKITRRTYKGRLVAPGFTKRSIRRISRIKGGKAFVLIGVRREAFTGIQFVDPGTKKMRAMPWFVKNFENSRNEMESRFSKFMKKRIEKATR